MAKGRKSQGATKEKASSEATFSCEICSKKFKTKGGLDYHKNKNVCQRESVTAELPVPSSVIAPPSVTAPQQPQPAVSLCCERCGKTYGSPQALKYHVSRNVCIKGSIVPTKGRSPGEPVKSFPERSFKRAEKGLFKSLFPQIQPSVEAARCKSQDTSEIIEGFITNSYSERRQIRVASQEPGDTIVHEDFVRAQTVSYESGYEGSPFTVGPLEGSCLCSKGATFTDIYINAHSKVYGLSFCPDGVGDFSFLAVATSPRFDSVNVLGAEAPDCSKNLLQLWGMSPTHHHHDGNAKNDVDPRLVFVVELPQSGTVFCISWYPHSSIGADESRLGLLAMSCSSGEVSVLSFPKPELSTLEGEVKPIALDLDKLSVFSQQLGCGVTGMTMDWTIQSELVCGLTDGTLIVWDLDQAAQPTVQDHHCPSQRLFAELDENIPSTPNPASLATEKTIYAVCCCSDDRNLVASLSVNSLIRMWDLRKPNFPIVQLAVTLASNTRSTHMSWPSGTNYLLVGDEGGKVTLVLLSSAESRSFSAHREKICAFVVNRNLRAPLLATGGSDGTVLCWSAPTMLHSIPPKPRVNPKTGKFPARNRRNDTFDIQIQSILRLCSPDSTIKADGGGNEEGEAGAVLVVSNFAPSPPSEPISEKPVQPISLDPVAMIPSRVSVNAVAWGDVFRDGKPYQIQQWLASGGNAGLIRCMHLPLEEA